MHIRFQVVSPASKRGTFDVRLPILLGRGDEARFKIQHHLVSRRHCELFDRDGQVYLRDLGSTNGTFLDGVQVPASTKTPVAPGATVRIGGLSFVVDYEGAHRAAAGTSPVTVPADLEQAAGQSRSTTDILPGGEEEPDFPIVHTEKPDVQATAEPQPGTGDDATEPPPADTAAPEPSAAAATEAAPAADPFAFLGSAPSPSAAEEPPWPSPESAAADGGDDGPDDALDAFFKGLK